jgi:hypothetical protein
MTSVVEFEVILARTVERPFMSRGITQVALGQTIATVNNAVSSEFSKLYFFFFAGLEPNGSARGMIQPHAIRRSSIECERAICFEKMIVAAYLNRSVTSISYQDTACCATDIRENWTLAFIEEIFTGFQSRSVLRCLLFDPSAQIRTASANRIMNRDKFRPVRKSSFHLNFVNHFCHAIHHLLPVQDFCPGTHDLSNCLSVARRFQHFSRKNRDRFNVVQFQAACLPLAREVGGKRNH